MKRKNYLDFIYKQIKKNCVKEAAHFAYYIKNQLDLQSLNQGKAVEQFLERCTGWDIIAEDGRPISEVGHKGDLMVEHRNFTVFPNVKSTMGKAFMGKSGNGCNGSIKVFDSSRTKNFNLLDSMRQIGGDLPIIHMTWDKSHCKGYFAITSLGECAEYFYGSDSVENIGKLFKSNDSGHYLITAKTFKETAKHHGRIIEFKLSREEKAIHSSVDVGGYNIMDDFNKYKNMLSYEKK